MPLGSSPRLGIVKTDQIQDHVGDEAALQHPEEGPANKEAGLS